MPTEQGTQDLFDRVAGLREQLAQRLGADLIANPQLAEALVRQVDELVAAAIAAQTAEPAPPDLGVAQLAGVGPQAAGDLGETRLPPGVPVYDETVVSERLPPRGGVFSIYPPTTPGG